MNAITTVLITQDEASLLERCVRSCQAFSDEVLVVDGGSADDTVQVAENLGCRVVVNPWPGYAAQRNHGPAQAAHDWIFWIDTDEAVDPGLAEALQRFRDGPPASEAALSILRVNQFMGDWLTSAAEVKVRLYDRRRCRMPTVGVHEAVACDGPVRHVPEVVWHFHHRGMDDATARLNRYTTLEAEDAAAARGMHPWRLLVRPAARFVQRFVAFRTYRLGWSGLVYAVHWAYWEFLREAKLLERTRPPAGDVPPIARELPEPIRAGPSLKRG